MSESPQPLIDSAELKVLKAILDGTAQATGEEFFRALVSQLCIATGVANAFIAELLPCKQRIRTLAFWQGGGFLPASEWAISGTPCEQVIAGKLCHYPSDVWKLFPDEDGVESYLGVPLVSSEGAVMGHLAMFDAVDMPPEPRLLYTFKIFAARAVAELTRLRTAEQLRLSEQRFRDLFDEAPIAYVHEDVESRFISANRAALRILGVKPEEVGNTVGMSLVPDTPDAQRRVKEAFASVGRGTDTGGVVLELRRKDDGKPIWIQWWSKPDPSGSYTRTMFIDITDKVLMEREQERLLAENSYLKQEIRLTHQFDEIVGNSEQLQQVLEKIRRVAVTDASVLIQGESGTGKELIARAIHSASKRSGKPLIKVNCAALPAALVESELFGHEKGAFTGAIAKHIGRFELADGGTLFLDEIGEIPLETQAKLLRALQEREFDRVGGKIPVKIDVRVIAATNRNLLQAVAEKTFRDDLYYRLNVFPISMPPLRQRKEDIPTLVAHMIAKFSARMDKAKQHISAHSLRLLQAYAWPGNIRELENVIERALILSDGPNVEIDPAWLPGAEAAGQDCPSKATAAGELATSLEQVERRHIITVLEQCGWVIEGERGAAQALGLHPSTLRYRINKLGIAKPRC